MSKHEFEELSIPKWKITAHEAANKVYRVFKDRGEFDEIEANSANEAMQKSGLDNAYMIRSGKIDSMTVFDQGMLAADEVAEAAMQEEAKAIAEQETAEVVEEDAVEGKEVPEVEAVPKEGAEEELEAASQENPQPTS